MVKKDLQSNNQKKTKSSGRGGKRAGAGRPKGALGFIKLRDCVTDEQIGEVLDVYIKNALKDGNTNRHFIEQIFGKAKQTIAGDDENPLEVKLKISKDSEELAKKFEGELKKTFEQ